MTNCAIMLIKIYLGCIHKVLLMQRALNVLKMCTNQPLHTFDLDYYFAFSGKDFYA